MPAAETDQHLSKKEVDRRFDLLVAQEFPSAAPSVGLARHWMDQVLTQIATGNPERLVFERLGTSEQPLVSDLVIEQIAAANNTNISTLVANVRDTRGSDLILATSENTTNAVQHAKTPAVPVVDLPTDNLGALEDALLGNGQGNTGLDAIIRAEMQPAPTTEKATPTQEKFVVALGVDTTNGLVSVLVGDGDPSMGKGLKKEAPRASNQSKRGGTIVHAVSDEAGFRTGSEIDVLRDLASFPVAKAAKTDFSPRRMLEAPHHKGRSRRAPHRNRPVQRAPRG